MKAKVNLRMKIYKAARMYHCKVFTTKNTKGNHSCKKKIIAVRNTDLQKQKLSTGCGVLPW